MTPMIWQTQMIWQTFNFLPTFAIRDSSSNAWMRFVDIHCVGTRLEWVATYLLPEKDQTRNLLCIKFLKMCLTCNHILKLLKPKMKLFRKCGNCLTSLESTFDFFYANDWKIFLKLFLWSCFEIISVGKNEVSSIGAVCSCGMARYYMHQYAVLDHDCVLTNVSDETTCVGPKFKIQNFFFYLEFGFGNLELDCIRICCEWICSKFKFACVCVR